MKFGDEPQPWQVVKSEYLMQRPWITVRRDHVRLQSGAEMPDYYVLEYTDWVNAALVTADRQVLLIRIYRHGLKAVHYELPGGCVDEQESPLTAAKRETLEETGFSSEDWTPLGICCANPATHSNRTFLYLAENAVKIAEPELEATEEIQTCLTPLAQLPEILESGQVISASHALTLYKLCRHYKL